MPSKLPPRNPLQIMGATAQCGPTKPSKPSFVGFEVSLSAKFSIGQALHPGSVSVSRPVPLPTKQNPDSRAGVRRHGELKIDEGV